MPVPGWLTVLAVTLAATPPRPLAAEAMRLVPLPPVWTAASAQTTHSPVPGAGIGGLRARPEGFQDGPPCLQELRRLGVPFRLAKATKGITTPVVVTGPVRGLQWSPMWGKKPALMDCPFALTLYKLAPAVLRSGVVELRYSSFYQYRNVSGSGYLSRHAFGLAVDVFEVVAHNRLRANVKKDWVKAIGKPGSCIGSVTSPKARLLRGLACNLEEARVAHLILTPDSDYAHRDHFHISGPRPGERIRGRSRYAGRLKGRTYIPKRAVRRPKRRRAHRRAHPRHHRRRRRSAARPRPARPQRR
ncbi:MAG: extensin family protein [bacterium]